MPKRGQAIGRVGTETIEMNDKYLRLSAEFDNYRKRTLKEKMELTKSAGEQLQVIFYPWWITSNEP